MPSSALHRRALLLACGGSFIALLDVTITNLALPAVAHGFGGVGVRALSWIVTLYAVLFAALLAPAGRLADVLGRRRLYLAGVVLFTLGSLGCALAPSYGALLGARAVQGIGAAGVLPASLAFVLADTPPERRPRAIGLWSAAASSAAVCGPSLGGVLVHAFGWRALFLINVPIGIALVALAVGVPAIGAAARGRIPDPLGTVCVAAGVGLVVLAVTEAEPWGATSPATLVALGAGLALTAVALWRSRRHPVPAVEVALWHSRTYRCANAVSFGFGASMFVYLFSGLLFTVGVWHYSLLRAGFAGIPGAFVSASVGLSSGRLQRRLSPRTLTIVGGLLLATSAIDFALTGTATPEYLAVFLPVNLLSGAGMGAISVGVSSAAAMSVPPPSFAAAFGLNVAARQVGGALGVAIAADVLARHAPSTVADYHAVWLMVAGTAFAVALLARGLRLAAPVPAPAPRAVEPRPATVVGS